jgi:vitamin B12 transport system substrate-binding protein
MDMRRAVRGLVSAILLFFVMPFALAADRVVSLAPSLTEMMLDLNAGELLVGVLDGAPRPAELAHLPSVGRYDQLDFETLVSLQPDLLLAWSDSLSGAQRSQLKQLNIPVYELAPRTLAQLGEQFARVGEQVGRAAQGRQLQQQFNAGIADLRRRYARPQPLRVFYQVSPQPLYTLGGQQIVSDALQVCGALNVFAELSLPAPQVGIEAVLEKNPQVILLDAAQQADAWQRWPMIDAVHRQQVWVLPDSGLERPSFQMLKSVAALCRLLAKAR